MSQLQPTAFEVLLRERPEAVELPAITVIIPTLCQSQRRESLRAAVQSVVSQRGVRAKALLAVNGNRADEDLLRMIEAEPGVEVLRIREAGIANALRSARVRVRTETFAFLDDDDVLLDGSLVCRWERMRQQGADVVVGNGHFVGREPILFDIDRLEADPLARLASGRNWLASPAGLFRTQSIDLEFFDGKNGFHEWTMLAFKLAVAGKKISFVGQLCYCLYETPGSAWRAGGERFHADAISVAGHCLRNSPKHLKPAFLNRWISALHDASEFHAGAGNRAAAWRLHAKCLVAGGWRFLPFTLRLAAASVSLPPAAHRAS
ncbi:MAG: glycosyltransferase [Bryobacteraceae bacterium]